MKITIDRKYTTLEQAAKVREDMNEFKNRYTDSDLKIIFSGTVDAAAPIYSGEILKTSVIAFPGGTDYGNETFFQVSMTIDCGADMYKIRYYCNLEMGIDTRKDLYEIQKYSEI